MRFAIVGSLHGELDKMYAEIKGVDAIVVCGNFQPFRNE